jgi:hypothetical protein
MIDDTKDSSRIDTIRTLVRPVLTIGGFLAATVLVFHGELEAEWYGGLVAGMVGFWFGGRKNATG